MEVSAKSAFSIENNVISPSIEIGAFEALWANGVSSFKKLREELFASNSDLPSNLIQYATAKQFYEKTVTRLHAGKIYHSK